MSPSQLLCPLSPLPYREADRPLSTKPTLSNSSQAVSQQDGLVYAGTARARADSAALNLVASGHDGLTTEFKINLVARLAATMMTTGNRAGLTN